MNCVRAFSLTRKFTHLPWLIFTPGRWTLYDCCILTFSDACFQAPVRMDHSKTAIPARVFLTHTCPIRQDAVVCCAPCGSTTSTLPPIWTSQLPARSPTTLSGVSCMLWMLHGVHSISLQYLSLGSKFRSTHATTVSSPCGRFVVCTTSLLAAPPVHTLSRVSGWVILKAVPSVTPSHGISSQLGAPTFSIPGVRSTESSQVVGVWLSEARRQFRMGSAAFQLELRRGCHKIHRPSFAFYELGRKVVEMFKQKASHLTIGPITALSALVMNS